VNDTSRTLPYKVADHLLRWAIFLQLSGFAIALWTRAGSGLGGIALVEWGVPHSTILAYEQAMAWVLLVSGVSILVYPLSFVLVGTALIMLIEATARYLFGGEPMIQYVIGAWVMRYMTAIALIPLILSPVFKLSNSNRLQAAGWILRIGIAVLFLIHGLEALYAHPYFIDLILGTSYLFFEVRPSESTAVVLLTVIAIVDFVVAAMVIVKPFRAVLYWAAFWGLVTALSRPLSLGFASYPEVLMRAPHFLAPLSLILILYCLNKRQDII